MTAISTSRNWFAIFRFLFGCLAVFSVLRFWYNNWIEELYILPSFHFTFPGLAFVKVLPPAAMYTLFGILGLCGILIALNAFYRAACMVFFLVFTYIELIDVTYYLNHYYLVSALALIMIFYDPRLPSSSVYNQRIIFFLKLQVSIVYFFGGVNKIGPDWLLHAQPLKIWLAANSDLSVIGKWLLLPAAAYIASWLSMIFDISVAFLLWFRKTRTAAYVVLSIFHIATALLFNIGIFPWVMMCAALLFFDPSLPVSHIFQGRLKPLRQRMATAVLALFAIFQLILPLRHLAFPGNYLYTERGFRFSWNIMLMEKNGMIEYAVQHKDGRYEDIRETDFLTAFQLKMLATQPDLILQFADHLKEYYRHRGEEIIAVHAESYVSLNGRPSALFFDPGINLIASQHELYESICSRAAVH